MLPGCPGDELEAREEGGSKGAGLLGAEGVRRCEQSRWAGPHEHPRPLGDVAPAPRQDWARAALLGRPGGLPRGSVRGSGWGVLGAWVSPVEWGHGCPTVLGPLPRGDPFLGRDLRALHGAAARIPRVAPLAAPRGAGLMCPVVARPV